MTVTAAAGLAHRALLKRAALACGSALLCLFISSAALGRADATPEQANQAGALAAKATDPSPKPAVGAQLKDYPFFPFCIDWHDAKKRGYAEQAVMLKELGYEGVGHIFLDGVAERLKTLDDAGLKLFQITMNVDVAPGKKPYDAKFKEVLGLIKGRHVQFCLLLNGMPPSDPSVDPHAVEILREMSDLAQDSGAQLLLYPHQGSWVERIEDSVRVAEKVNRPNVGVMFNLCHWLRVDKQRDYKHLLVQAMPRLWAISICGADEFDPKPGWEHYIQPLDKGSFDVGLAAQDVEGAWLQRAYRAAMLWDRRRRAGAFGALAGRLAEAKRES